MTELDDAFLKYENRNKQKGGVVPNAWSTYCTKALEHRQWVVCLSDLFEEKKISATKLHRLVSIIIMLYMMMYYILYIRYDHVLTTKRRTGYTTLSMSFIHDASNIRCLRM